MRPIHLLDAAVVLLAAAILTLTLAPYAPALLGAPTPPPDPARIFGGVGVTLLAMVVNSSPLTSLLTVTAFPPCPV